MKHIRLSVNVLVVAALFVTAGCADAEDKKSERVKENGFSIVPPAGWENKGELAGNFMNFVGPTEGNFVVNFNVNVQKHDGSPIEGAESEIKAVLKQIFADYETAYDGFVDIDGRKCYYLSGKFTVGALHIQNLQYCIMTKDKKKVYTATFTTSAETFEKYKPVFEKAALTVQAD